MAKTQKQLAVEALRMRLRRWRRFLILKLRLGKPMGTTDLLISCHLRRQLQRLLSSRYERRASYRRGNRIQAFEKDLAVGHGCWIDLF